MDYRLVLLAMLLIDALLKLTFKSCGQGLGYPFAGALSGSSMCDGCPRFPGTLKYPWLYLAHC